MSISAFLSSLPSVNPRIAVPSISYSPACVLKSFSISGPNFLRKIHQSAVPLNQVNHCFDERDILNNDLPTPVTDDVPIIHYETSIQSTGFFFSSPSEFIIDHKVRHVFVIINLLKLTSFSITVLHVISPSRCDAILRQSRYT